jgi:hypothetical protein
MHAERSVGRPWFRLPRGGENAAAVVLIAACAILYVLCASGELWFDEVLSLQWAKNASSFPEIITLYRHDNNHPLNTLWIYLVGQGRSELVYRAFSVVSGVMALVLIRSLGRRLTPSASWVPFILAASSYAMMLYASEARGYAPAMACSLAAVWLLFLDPLPGLHPLRLAVFWLVSVTGILAHATAVYPLIALGLWFIAVGVSAGRSWGSVVGSAVAWFGLPALVFVAFFAVFLRPMMVAGGPSYPAVAIAADFFGYGFGLPVAGPWAVPTILFGLAALVAGLTCGRFEIPSARLFFIFVIAVVPMAGLLVAAPEHLYFRYFLVSLPFGFLVLGGLAARAPSGSAVWRTAITVALALIVAVQVPRIASLIQQGRGGARSVLETIAASGAAGQSVISNHDMMIGMVLEFYRGRDRRFAGVQYLPQWVEKQGAADWLVISSQDQPPPEPAPACDVEDASYRLVAHLTAAPVSGSHWTLYRRAAQAK